MNEGQPYPPGLSDHENAQLFNERIRPTLTGTTRPDPLAVWVGGQPGAGKSSVQRAVLHRLGRQDAYPLDGDDLVAQHPHYQELQRRNDLSAAYLASEDLKGRWWTRAARLLRARRIDLVVSAPLAGPAWARARMQEFSRAGYRNEAVVVATHEAQSLQGMVSRYHANRSPQTNAYGRWVLPEWHDIAYRGVLDTADMIDRDRVTDAVHVGRRDGTLVHTNERAPDGTWRLNVSTRQAIEADRNRPWTAQETAEFLQKQGQLRATTTPEWRPLLDQIDQRAIPVAAPVAVLTGPQLAEQLEHLAVAREQAVLQAEAAQIKASLLAEQHQSGADERHLTALREGGASPQHIEQVRTVLNHDRWAAGMSAGRLGQHADDLQALRAGAVAELDRRTILPQDARQAEEHGRTAHQAQHPGQLPSLVPRPAQPVIVERTTPRDPGPTPQPEPAPAADNRPAPAGPDTAARPARPTAASETARRLDRAYGGPESASSTPGRRPPPRADASSPGR